LAIPWPRLFWIGLLLLAFGLRLVLWNRFPFREDEAVYSYWALHSWHKDPLFLTVWPDKPPLFIWSLSLVFRLFGASEASARALNIVLSTVTIPVVAETARHLWGRTAARMAGLVLALSPFAISFAPTAYTDPMLVFWGSLALLAAVRSNTFWAGVSLGAAIMTKQQGLFYAPLILGALVVATSPFGKGSSSIRNTAGVQAGKRRPLLGWPGTFLLGFLLTTGPVLLWDALRWSVAPSPWDLSVQHYGGLRLVSLADWLPRLVRWAGQVWYLGASRLVWVAMLSCIGLASASTLFDRWRRPGSRPSSTESTTPEIGFGEKHLSDQHRTVWLLWLWLLAFLAAHVVLNMQVWDRYLLPLAPVLALLFGWAVAQLSRINFSGLARAPVQAAWIGLWLAVLIAPAWAAAQGGLPVGGDHGDYAGLRAAVAWLQNEAPPNAIIYHQSLGWHYQFYLFDRIGPGGYDLRWFSSTVYLADNAAKTPHRRKFVIQPDWAPLRDAAVRLPRRGVQWVERLRSGRFTVYELVLASQPYCEWCLCTPQTTKPEEILFANPGVEDERYFQAGFTN
jgi:hypothetical protein